MLCRLVIMNVFFVFSLGLFLPFETLNRKLRGGINDCSYGTLCSFGNSTVLGGIEIGNDVMIAPNTFVNQDIPSHSIVIGNPCKIIHKEDATKDYVFYKV